MFSRLKKKNVTTRLEKQTSTRSLLRFPKISFDRWRSPAVVTPTVKSNESTNHGTHYITTTSSPRTQAVSQVQESGANSKKQPVIVQAQESRASTTRKSSVSRDRQSRSQERHLITISAAHSTNSSRSRSRSKFAFTRSQSNPGYQRIIKVDDTTGYRKQETSVRYQQRERVEGKDCETIEISRGRRDRHSYISPSRARRSENRTPSPLPELDLTPVGTPCSSRSLGPSTPVHSENDYQQTNTKARPPIIIEISPSQQNDTKNIDGLSTIDSEFYTFPENYYKPHCPKYQRSNSESIVGAKSQQASCNNLNEVSRHRRLVVDPNLSDGSRLRSVSTGRAHITANASRKSSIPILAQDLLVPEEPIPTPTIPNKEISSNPSTHVSKTLQSDNDKSLEPTINPKTRETPPSKGQPEPSNQDPLPRKPASFERLRPSLTNCQAELPPPPSDSRPSHQRTRSEAVNTEPQLMRSHTRSISTYSYTPIRDLRPERRSYNTVRFLDSQGQNHERLRRVLGI